LGCLGSRRRQFIQLESLNGIKQDAARRALGLSTLAKLFRCDCGGWFISRWYACRYRQCAACRKPAALDRVREYTHGSRRRASVRSSSAPASRE
jgi:hypothetical protein